MRMEFVWHSIVCSLLLKSAAVMSGGTAMAIRVPKLVLLKTGTSIFEAIEALRVLCFGHGISEPVFIVYFQRECEK